VPGDAADETILWYEGAGIGDRRWLGITATVYLTPASATAAATLLLHRDRPRVHFLEPSVAAEYDQPQLDQW
jgi:hypothetical protein